MNNRNTVCGQQYLGIAIRVMRRHFLIAASLGCLGGLLPTVIHAADTATEDIQPETLKLFEKMWPYKQQSIASLEKDVAAAKKLAPKGVNDQERSRAVLLRERTIRAAEAKLERAKTGGASGLSSLPIPMKKGGFGGASWEVVFQRRVDDDKAIVAIRKQVISQDREGDPVHTDSFYPFVLIGPNDGKKFGDKFDLQGIAEVIDMEIHTDQSRKKRLLPIVQFTHWDSDLQAQWKSYFHKKLASQPKSP